MDQRPARAGRLDHGDSAATPHEARSEAHLDAVAPAGDQAVADVHARARRTADAGDGREPDARGGAGRGAPGGRRRGGPGKGRASRRRSRRPTPGTTRTTSTSSATISTTGTGRARSRKSRNCRPSRARSRPRRRSPTTCSGSCRSRPTTTRCARSARPSSGTSTTTATWWRRWTRSRRWARGRVEDVARALTLVQGFDPIGVAARDLQECLPLQLRHLGLEGTPTERIVTEHLRLLQNHQVPELARKLGDLDRGAEAAHRDHPAPRPEAGQPLQPRRSRST